MSMIEIGTRPTIVIEAAPFCFGPVSTTLAIAQVLRQSDVAIIWLAEGTSLELLRAGETENDDFVIPFSLTSQTDRKKYSHYVEEADVVLVNTDPEFAEYALGLNSNVVYLDILYWMWHELPAVARRCARYIYESFVRCEAQEQRLGLPAGARRVGPLINNTKPVRDTRGDAGHLLVSIGGLNRPGNQSSALLTEFREGIFRQVLASLPAGRFHTVYFAGGGIAPEILQMADGTTVRKGCLSKEEYLRLLCNARAAVLSPGLTGFYEAAAAGVPSFYLPPHNYSQYLQLETFRSVLTDNAFCDWHRLGIQIDLPCFLPEEEMLGRVDIALQAVVEKLPIIENFLRPFLSGGYEYFDPRTSASLLSASAGNGENASEIASEIILSHLTGSVVRTNPRKSFDSVPLPRKVTLELFGGCQLRCPLCPTGQRLRPGPAHGALAMETVRALLDEISGHTEIIELFNWGEPFLHPEACEIIRMIADRGIRTVISSNLQRIPRPIDIINSGLSELIFSCHGMTQATYEKYMVGGELATALEHFESIVAAAGSQPTMKFVLRFVVFSHNEHELGLAIERFRGTPVEVEVASMRMDMRDEILAPPGRNLQIYGQWVPESSRYYDKLAGRANRGPAGCNLPFEEVAIGVDGTVSPCCSCYDPQHTLGNVLHAGSLTAVWNSESYQKARRVVSGRFLPGDESVICHTCKKNGYRDF